MEKLNNINRISIMWKWLIVLTGSIGLVSTAWGMEHPIVMFYFYTVLSNILCVGAFLYLSIQNTKAYPVVKGGLATAILIVMLIFHFVLRPTSEFYENQIGLADLILHYVMPFMVVLDFILFEKRNQIKWYHPIIWLTIPIAYVIFIFIRAQVGQPFETGYGLSLYPYIFLDINQLGIMGVSKWVIGILTFYLLIGYLVMVMDRGCYMIKQKLKSI